MPNLQDLINLAKIDGGKFFVMDEKGEAKLIIMPIEEYERLLVGKLANQIEDIETINNEILKAKLQEKPVEPLAEAPYVAEDFRRTQIPPKVDMRSEVIDPSFDFEGPKVELEDL